MTPADAALDQEPDGLTNLEEFEFFDNFKLFLDPLDDDTDNDGVLDGVELDLGFDPTDSDDIQVTIDRLLIIVGIISTISITLIMKNKRGKRKSLQDRDKDKVKANGFWSKESSDQ